MEVFDGTVYIEEKLDGSQFSIVLRNGDVEVYSRGRNIVRGFEPTVYRGIWSWVYSRYSELVNVPEYYVLYGEWLRVRHTVPYDMLPDWAVIFDVLDLRSNRFLDYSLKKRVVDDLGLTSPPLVCVLNVKCSTRRDVDDVVRKLARLAEGKSAFSRIARSMEDVVVKNYGKNLFAKLINPWFDREVEEHELFGGGVKFNRLACWSKD